MDDLKETLWRVRELVEKIVDPVTAALEEIERAKKSRRLAFIGMTLMIAASVAVDVFVVLENRTLVQSLHRLHLEQTVQRVETSVAEEQVKEVIEVTKSYVAPEDREKLEALQGLRKSPPDNIVEKAARRDPEQFERVIDAVQRMNAPIESRDAE